MYPIQGRLAAYNPTFRSRHARPTRLLWDHAQDDGDDHDGPDDYDHDNHGRDYHDHDNINDDWDDDHDDDDWDDHEVMIRMIIIIVASWVR